MSDNIERLTTKRAKADLVIGPFIAKAIEELSIHRRFKIESLVKALNVQLHREPLYRYMPRIARIIEREHNCKLVPFCAVDMLGHVHLAGVGQGSKTIGYCQVSAEYAEIADAANSRRVGLTNGVARVHNEVAGILQTETGKPRDRLTVDLGKLPPPSPTLRLAKTFVEALKGIDEK